ncbi:MAG: hypothetical protein O3C01_00010 [Bacteroidetes bacterium]|jgi:hypothetical protein|nr:hypothetical protein [Bacteroidota bacterium]MDA1018665.1 hypothetical protein [Bacteroidota bacterium]
MKKISLLFVFLVICGFVNHKYYVSTSLFNFNYSNDIEITIRIFKDDLNSLFEMKYSDQYKSNSDLNSPLIQTLISTYLENNIGVYFDKVKYQPNFLGSEEKNDLVICYLEIEKIPISNFIKIENKILFDLFLDQKNIIHVKKNSEKQSFILTKKSSKFQLDI